MDGKLSVTTVTPDRHNTLPARQTVIKKTEIPVRDDGDQNMADQVGALEEKVDALLSRASNLDKKEEKSRQNPDLQTALAKKPISPSYTDAQYAYDKKIDRFTITITDQDNNQVIKEIPPEATRKTLEALQVARGNYLDQGI